MLKLDAKSSDELRRLMIYREPLFVLPFRAERKRIDGVLCDCVLVAKGHANKVLSHEFDGSLCDIEALTAALLEVGGPGWLEGASCRHSPLGQKITFVEPFDREAMLADAAMKY